MTDHEREWEDRADVEERADLRHRLNEAAATIERVAELIRKEAAAIGGLK